MASIIERKRKDGTSAFRAQIIIKQGGKIVHREGETFDNRADANEWGKRREAALNKRGGLETAIATRSGITLKELIELYEKKLKPIKPWGKSKQGTLNYIKGTSWASTVVTDIDSAWVIDYCIDRKATTGVEKSTINQDYSFMRSIFSVAKDMLRVPVNVQPFDEARPVLGKLDLVGKSKERERRPEAHEISAIMQHASNSAHSIKNRHRENMPIDKLIVFQMFSGRRISETCRLLWSDLDRAKKTILVRDMKDPSAKIGNNVVTLLTDEALAVIDSMPEDNECIFPFNPRSVEARFQRTRDKAGFYTGTDDDLRLHDLRHECLSWLAEKNGLKGQNWDIPRLQMVSGHKNWNVLQRYVNLLSEKPHDRWKSWEWKKKVL